MAQWHMDYPGFELQIELYRLNQIYPILAAQYNLTIFFFERIIKQF